VPPLITGLILAGGRGERMQGADKGLLPLDARPLVAHVRDALAPQVATLLINANRHREAYARFGCPVVADAWPEGRGPLAGMLAGLEAARTDWVLCVACDVPRVPGDLAARLLAGAGVADAAYAAHGSDAYYTCCLLRRHLAPRLRAAIEQGTRAVHRWLADCGAVRVELPDALPNLNTPALLAAAQAA
jgi:molybdopterin-guanine dinucleotide biosynthesis protein A